MLQRIVIPVLLLLMINFDGVIPESKVDTILSDDFIGMMEGLEFSLVPSRSDIQKNLVITGIKFSTQESIICMQIKQGKLLPEGKIDEDSEKWMTCDESRSSDPTHRLEGSDRPTDYIDIDEEFNYIDLDDVVDEHGRIVTGAAFILTDQCPGVQHIKLGLEYTRFNFTSGQLDSQRTSLSSSTCHTNEINISDIGNSINDQNSRNQNIQQPISNGFVKLRLSDLKENVGLKFLSLLDAQPVETTPSAPLSGIGLFYKSSPGNEAVLTLDIHSLNYSEYVKKREVDKSSNEDRNMLTSSSAPRRVKREREFTITLSLNGRIIFLLMCAIWCLMLGLMVCWYCKCLCKFVEHCVSNEAHARAHEDTLGT